MPRDSMAIGLAVLAGVAGLEAAAARPARLILLRHGEKKTSAELCDIGIARADALSQQYLGKGAPGNATIYGVGGKPDAFFAVTAHTQETAAPSAASWGQPVTAFSVPPKDPDEDSDLDIQTRKAAAVLGSAAYDGKTVVVVWEHKRIAKKAMNAEGTTFWSLLDLGDIPGADVPTSWEGANYDYFWIVDNTHAQPTFAAIRQTYPAAAQIPDNAWGEHPDPQRFAKFYQDCKD